MNSHEANNLLSAIYTRGVQKVCGPTMKEQRYVGHSVYEGKKSFRSLWLKMPIQNPPKLKWPNFSTSAARSRSGQEWGTRVSSITSWSRKSLGSVFTRLKWLCYVFLCENMLPLIIILKGTSCTLTSVLCTVIWLASLHIIGQSWM